MNNVEETMSIEQLVAAVLGVDVDSVVDTSGAGKTNGWDSLNHLNIISALEETFDVLFTTEEMRSCSSVGALKLALQSKGVEV